LYVYAVSTSSVLWNGRKIRVTVGVPWRADDPFVKAHMDMFSRKPPIVGSTTENPEVERATRAPGEKRG
jgi:hypothetical protein